MMGKKPGPVKCGLFALLLLSLVVATACAPKLSSAFDQATVEQSAQDVIQLINDQNSEELLAMSTPEVKAALTDDVLASIYSAIGEGGAFKNITSMKVVGSTQGDVNYAVVVAVAEYEDKSFTYTITFTEDMKLAGLFYR